MRRAIFLLLLLALVTCKSSSSPASAQITCADNATTSITCTTGKPVCRCAGPYPICECK